MDIDYVRSNGGTDFSTYGCSGAHFNTNGGGAHMS